MSVYGLGATRSAVAPGLIAINQDALGKQGWRAHEDGVKEVWIKPLENGDLAVGLFNRGESAEGISVRWDTVKRTGPQGVMDAWRQKDCGSHARGYSMRVGAHGGELLRISSSPGK